MCRTVKTTLSALLLLALASAGQGAPAATGDPAAALPRDTLAVVRVTGLEAAWKGLFRSAAWRRIEDDAPGNLSAGLREARAGLEQIEEMLGVDLEACAGGLFGTDMALALLPDRTGLFVTRSTDLARLEDAVDAVRRIEREDRKLAGETQETYKGVDIVSARLVNPRDTEAEVEERHHAITGNMLIVSESRAAVQRAIDCCKAPKTALATSPEYRDALGLAPADALLRVYIDTDRLAATEAVDEWLRGDAENVLTRMFARSARQILPATRYAVASFVADKARAELLFRVVYADKELPASIRAMLPASEAPLDIARLAPPGAVVSLAHRVDKTALWQFLLATVRESDAATAVKMAQGVQQIAPMLGGQSFEKDVLPQLGEQAALIGLPGDDKTSPSAAMVVELRDTQKLPMALRSMAGMMIFGAQMNARKLKKPAPGFLKPWRHRETDVTTIVLHDPKLDGKLNPTLFVKGKFMVLATGPQVARAILDAADAPPRAATPASAGTPVFHGRIDVRGLEALHSRFREFLVRDEMKKGATEEKARSDQEALGFLLGFFDRLDFAVEHVPGRMDRRLTIRMRDLGKGGPRPFPDRVKTQP